jgi:hypothetical protein
VGLRGGRTLNLPDDPPRLEKEPASFYNPGILRKGKDP